MGERGKWSCGFNFVVLFSIQPCFSILLYYFVIFPQHYHYAMFLPNLYGAMRPSIFSSIQYYNLISIVYLECYYLCKFWSFFFYWCHCSNALLRCKFTEEKIEWNYEQNLYSLILLNIFDSESTQSRKIYYKHSSNGIY